MFSGYSAYKPLLKLPMSLLVKATVIPSKPIEDLAVDLNSPIVYALPFYSSADVFILQKKAKELGFPDPLTPIEINGKTLPRCVFIFSSPRLFNRSKSAAAESVDYFTELLDLHKTDPSLNIQVIPTSMLWGRKPGKEQKNTPYLKAMGKLEKIIAIITNGRDSLVRFSPFVSMRYMADHHGTDARIAHKLARVALIHFSRQKLAASGPNLPNRQALIERLSQSQTIQTTTEQYAKDNNISLEKAQKETNAILDEIAADFSYNLVKAGDYFLSGLWNRIYQGININNASTVRKLAQDGHEIVYLPCHRSHMDYLLLSYVLYREGMAPPHIAAGINLNFFPAGPIFRRGGAFFIRRTFKDSKLYPVIFREYLAELFSKGYSVEYFTEGGRSRTGRLLAPKAGMLSMTIEAMLRGLQRPVTIVPVYIGYEHVIEVNTYTKELSGKQKEKENAGLVLRTIRKLKNFGKCYVNFGEPININQYLSQQAPNWSQDINPMGAVKPQWLMPAVGQLAKKVMVNINDAVAINALALCATALLASRQRALSKDSLEAQVQCYLSLTRNVRYSNTSTVWDGSAEELVTHALSLNKFVVETDSIGQIISLDRRQSILMTYYRNNIMHVLIIPSIIAQMLICHRRLSTATIKKHLALLYPFLQEELFLSIKIDELDQYIKACLNELFEQNLVLNDEETDEFVINQANIQRLMLLGATSLDSLHRYAVTFNLLEDKPSLSAEDLEITSQAIAQRLGQLHGINAPEFFDKGSFAALLTTLKAEGYISEEGPHNLSKTKEFAQMLYSMINPETKLTIEESIHQINE